MLKDVPIAIMGNKIDKVSAISSEDLREQLGIEKTEYEKKM